MFLHIVYIVSNDRVLSDLHPSHVDGSDRRQFVGATVTWRHWNVAILASARHLQQRWNETSQSSSQIRSRLSSNRFRRQKLVRFLFLSIREAVATKEHISCTNFAGCWTHDRCLICRREDRSMGKIANNLSFASRSCWLLPRCQIDRYLCSVKLTGC
jgi:hypothetical protein